LTYDYVLQHGLATMSLRPLAEAIGSSPRVLLFLFGSKDGLIRALLVRARQEELALLLGLHHGGPDDLAAGALQIWSWVSDPQHRKLLRLWVEGYARSLMDNHGPWAGFADLTVRDWLTTLAELQPANRRNTAAAEATRTLVLAVLRGALLDLLATGDLERTTAAVQQQLQTIGSVAGEMAERNEPTTVAPLESTPGRQQPSER
jgi:AcrR family transcriptional regulator